MQNSGGAAGTSANTTVLVKLTVGTEHVQVVRCESYAPRPRIMDARRGAIGHH